MHEPAVPHYILNSAPQRECHCLWWELNQSKLNNHASNLVLHRVRGCVRTAQRCSVASFPQKHRQTDLLRRNVPWIIWNQYLHQVGDEKVSVEMPAHKNITRVLSIHVWNGRHGDSYNSVTRCQCKVCLRFSQITFDKTYRTEPYAKGR